MRIMRRWVVVRRSQSEMRSSESSLSFATHLTPCRPLTLSELVDVSYSAIGFRHLRVGSRYAGAPHGCPCTSFRRHHHPPHTTSSPKQGTAHKLAVLQ